MTKAATTKVPTAVRPSVANNSSAKGAPVYERLVLKLSGESLSGPNESGIHAETIQGIAREVQEVRSLGVDVAIVVGGGNFFRGTRQKSSTLTAQPAITWACWPR